MKKTINIALGFIFAISTMLSARAQTSAPAQSSAQTQTPAPAQGQSPLGDYARKANKDTGAKPKPKVYDNDNLPTDDKLSVVGPKPGSAADAAPADSAATDKPKPGASSDQAKKDAALKEWEDKLTAQKNQVDLASRELDVTQREYQLRVAAMYADTGNRLRNEAQWDKQDADYKQKIADKQKAIEDAKQKLTDMEEDARKAGVPSNTIE